MQIECNFFLKKGKRMERGEKVAKVLQRRAREEREIEERLCPLINGYLNY